MTKAHILGYPRIGEQRQLKFAVEAYWRGEIEADQLSEAAREVCLQNWQQQYDAGLDFVTVGDFSFYDHVLDTSLLLGVVPKRFRRINQQQSNSSKQLYELYFRMARGSARQGDSEQTYACEMTKWFDTNYHYLVPEFEPEQTFQLLSTQLFEQVAAAQAAGFQPKPVLLGPLSFLWLGKTSKDFDRLRLLDRLLPVYREVLNRLQTLGVEWVQIDEPALVMDLTSEWRQAYESAYNQLSAGNPKILLTTYFGGLLENMHLAVSLPTAGLHIDVVRAAEQLVPVLDKLPPYKVLSLGVVNGRNVWRTDLDAALQLLRKAQSRVGQRLWVASSCSLLHSPLNLELEKNLNPELRPWLAFAKQKLAEIKLLTTALLEGDANLLPLLNESRQARLARHESALVHKQQVREAVADIQADTAQRASPYLKRAAVQSDSLSLPEWPTTTIGSFPQTGTIRQVRRQFKRGEIDAATYQAEMKDEIASAIKKQEAYGLDVLVHGEAERTDMVEYFAEALEGMAVTDNAWVQSYGTRCIKPPIIFGDVQRQYAITVQWAQYAQSLSSRPVKGMLTGPVTMLQWSFVRDDQPREETCKQIALALRQEVLDLEAAGIQIIQIDEPAFREGLPLRERNWKDYLQWAVFTFRLSAAGVQDSTQIHTHMCYSEFNDILESIADLDADVVTLEASRSRMVLLEAFQQFEYLNEIGPGVYDIHSPRIPAVSEMVTLLAKAARYIPMERLWVNPDCGLKTRSWDEVEPALINMVTAARQLREMNVAA